MYILFPGDNTLNQQLIIIIHSHTILMNIIIRAITLHTCTVCFLSSIDTYTISVHCSWIFNRYLISSYCKLSSLDNFNIVPFQHSLVCGRGHSRGTAHVTSCTISWFGFFSWFGLVGRRSNILLNL